MIWRAVRLRKVPCRRHGVSDASEGHCVDYGSTWVLGVVKWILLQNVAFVMCIRTKCDFYLQSGLHGVLHGVARNLEVINVCEYFVMA